MVELYEENGVPKEDAEVIINTMAKCESVEYQVYPRPPHAPFTPHSRPTPHALFTPHSRPTRALARTRACCCAPPPCPPTLSSAPPHPSTVLLCSLTANSNPRPRVILEAHDEP